MFVGVARLSGPIPLYAQPDGRLPVGLLKLVKLAEPANMKAALQSLKVAGKRMPFKLKPEDVDNWADADPGSEGTIELSRVP